MGVFVTSHVFWIAIKVGCLLNDLSISIFWHSHTCFTGTGLQNLTLAVGFVFNPPILLVTYVTSSTVGLVCASSLCLGVIQMLTMVQKRSYLQASQGSKHD